MALVVVCPTRGRPGQARELVESFRQTAVLASTKLVLVVDEDDPQCGAYETMVWNLSAPRIGSERRPTLVVLKPAETGNLVKATNAVSMRIAEAGGYDIIANFGDDHRPRTDGWDRAVTKALASPGVAYGDDLLQGEELPTAPFISAQIVLALGYYFLPDLAHMYADNAVRDIAVQAGVRHYLPGVIIEHCHPFAHKAEWDDGYRRVNAEEPVREDRLRYESWREHAMATDVERVRQALAVVV